MYSFWYEFGCRCRGHSLIVVQDFGDLFRQLLGGQLWKKEWRRLCVCLRSFKERAWKPICQDWVRGVPPCMRNPPSTCHPKDHCPAHPALVRFISVQKKAMGVSGAVEESEGGTPWSVHGGVFERGEENESREGCRFSPRPLFSVLSVPCVCIGRKFCRVSSVMMTYKG